MRFASLGGSNAASYAAAGKSVADSAVKSFAVQRKTGPDYAGLSKVAMTAQSAEKIAGMQASADVYESGIQALNTAHRSKIKGQQTVKLGDIKNKQRMAGVLPAIGKIVGSGFKKTPKRPPPILQAEPVKPADVKWGGDVGEGDQAPDPLRHSPLVAQTSSTSDGSTSSTSTSSQSTPGVEKGIRSKVFNYLTNEKGLSRNKSLGFMANIDRESGFNPSIRSGDDGGPGGLFQWKGSRQTSAVANLVNTGDWKGQIDYALNEPGEAYSQTFQQTTFNSPLEAANGWMKNWERPADLSAGSKKHTNFLAGYSF